jgi:hypothetical protein
MQGSRQGANCQHGSMQASALGFPACCQWQCCSSPPSHPRAPFNYTSLALLLPEEGNCLVLVVIALIAPCPWQARLSPRCVKHVNSLLNSLRHAHHPWAATPILHGGLPTRSFSTNAETKSKQKKESVGARRARGGPEAAPQGPRPGGEGLYLHANMHIKQPGERGAPWGQSLCAATCTLPGRRKRAGRGEAGVRGRWAAGSHVSQLSPHGQRRRKVAALPS